MAFGPETYAWVQFALSLIVMGYAGSRLTYYGEAIAQRTGLGSTWVGLVLVATVTSLPELVTGSSAVLLARATDTAIGTLLGSCVFNLLLIVLLDFLHRGSSVYQSASQGHILAGGFGVVMISVVGLNVLIYENGGSALLGNLALGWVGSYTPFLLLVYGVGMRTLFRYARRQEDGGLEAAAASALPSLGAASGGFAVSGLVVAAVALWLPFVGEQLVESMGWHRTFVGTLFIGFTTSMPEVVVTLAALRMGALNLAIGDLFGSNLFNIAVIPILDLIYLDGPILRDVSALHVVSAFSAVQMTGIAIIGLLYRPATRVFRTVGWGSLLLVLIYVLNALVLYLYTE